MSKSILKSKDEEKKWILDRDGYTVTSEDFKYKSRVVMLTFTSRG